MKGWMGQDRYVLNITLHPEKRNPIFIRRVNHWRPNYPHRLAPARTARCFHGPCRQDFALSNQLSCDGVEGAYVVSGGGGEEDLAVGRGEGVDEGAGEVLGRDVSGRLRSGGIDGEGLFH